MKRILILPALLCMTLYAVSQPSWHKKASKSVFTLKTFSADGSLLASSNGFFTGKNGEGVSNYTPFKGAARAVVIDAQGKEMEVVSILGADDMYDVVRFRLNNDKTQPLTVSSATTQEGCTTWLLPYRGNPCSGRILKSEKFNKDYDYYTISMMMPEQAVSCPMLNDAGEVIGLMQQPATLNDTLCYAVSASYAESLTIAGFTFFDKSLQQTQIKKDLPDDLKEANIAVYLAASNSDSLTYMTLVNDMIKKFPNAPDGYTYRAQQEASQGDFEAADKDMSSAIRLSDKKDEALFTYARMIYNKEVYQSELTYDNWTLDLALSRVQEAVGLNPQPTYRQLEAEVLYAQKKYDEAYRIFMELTATSLRGADVFFSAARCKEMLNDTTAMLALMDSTMATFSRPYLKEAAPYLWARAAARRNAGKYRDAVNDMNDYEQLMTASVNDNFYYIRHLTEIEARLYQQALNDIDKAIRLNPQETLYYAEKASLLIRVGHLDDAVTTANELIVLVPDNSDGYLFLGLAQCLKGNKADGIRNLQKAKELGDTQAEALITKYQ